MPRRTFARTAAALRVYQAAGDALEALPPSATTAELEAAITTWDAALAKVGEAFALDADRQTDPFEHFGHLIKFARKCVEAAQKV